MIEAENGEEALDAVAEQRPDLILMDIQLPVIDGYEATRRIKANPALKHIPIIVVTSYALSGDEDKARAAGCDAYVTKPYSPRAAAGQDPRVPAVVMRSQRVMHSPPRILIVDDNETNRDILMTRLGAAGLRAHAGRRRRGGARRRAASICPT